MVAISLIVNFIVNGISAYAMSAKYGIEGTTLYVVFTVCAYALPILIGGVSDIVSAKLRKNSGLVLRRFHWGITILGLLFSLIGMYAGVYALGVGNALTVVGSGMSIIHDDSGKKVSVFPIATFLAVGIPGYWVGNVLAGFTSLYVYIQNLWIALSIIIVAVGLLYIVYRERSFQFVSIGKSERTNNPGIDVETKETVKEKIGLLYVALLTWQLISSSIGAFEACIYNYGWYDQLLLSVIKLGVVVLGLVCGGLIAQVYCARKSIFFSIAGILSVLAAVFIIVPGTYLLVGMASLFFTNIVMAMLASRITTEYPRVRGISIGILYLGVFAGVMLYYFRFA